MSQILQYIIYFITFIISETISMWGQYSYLKYPNMGYLETFMRAIPFAWLNWFFMTIAVNIGDKYKLVTPMQDMFLDYYCSVYFNFIN